MPLLLTQAELDKIFKPRYTPKRGDVNYSGQGVGGQDISNFYEPSTAGSADQIDFDTGFLSNGVDLRYLFRDKTFIDYPMFRVRAVYVNQHYTTWGSKRERRDAFFVIAINPDSLFKQNGLTSVTVTGKEAFSTSLTTFKHPSRYNAGVQNATFKDNFDPLGRTFSFSFFINKDNGTVWQGKTSPVSGTNRMAFGFETEFTGQGSEDSAVYRNPFNVPNPLLPPTLTGA